jgi:hypothetical protein
MTAHQFDSLPIMRMNYVKSFTRVTKMTS